MSGGGPRGLDSLGWKSFWDLGTPLKAAAILFELYGDEALEKVAEAETAARANSRDTDVRFWNATRAVLNRCNPRPPVLVRPR